MQENYKLVVISDLHVTSNDKIIDGIPLNYVLISNAINHIMDIEHPDILIINGDIIDNVNKIDVPTISFLNLLIYSISQKCPVYINTGNHDIIESGYNNDTLSSISNVLTIFNGLHNVYTIKKPTKVNILDSLFLYFIPYTKNIDMLIESINQYHIEDFGYHLIFGHTDIDFIDEEITHMKGMKNFPYKILKSKFDAYKYQSLWGHYHIGKEYPNYNLKIISSLLSTNFGDESKIDNIHDIETNYNHGYYVIEFENTNNVKYIFKPNPIGKRFISLNETHILDESDCAFLLDYIKSNKDMYFNIRVHCNMENVEEIKNKLSAIYTWNNIMQIQIIPINANVNVDMSHNISHLDITTENIYDILIDEIGKFVDDTNIDKYTKYLKKLIQKI